MTDARQAPWSARVTKDSLVFSAAHFITFNETICERLHGHNWRVDVVMDGILDANGYVYDFIAIRDAAMTLVARLDHRVLLPATHPLIHVQTNADGREVHASFEDRRWVFPVEDCVILPVVNTTAELIAGWFAQELISALQLDQVRTLTALTVSIEENFGQWATYRHTFRGNEWD